MAAYPPPMTAAQRGRGHPLTPDERVRARIRVRRLRAWGWSIRSIAAYLGLGVATVHGMRDVEAEAARAAARRRTD